MSELNGRGHHYNGYLSNSDEIKMKTNELLRDANELAEAGIFSDAERVVPEAEAPSSQVTQFIKSNPVLSASTALALGYAISRLFAPKRK